MLVKRIESRSLKNRCTCHIGLLPCQIHSWNLIQHGKTCEKVMHHNGEGFLHGEHDDRPYDVDGVEYCGRCHVAL